MRVLINVIWLLIFCFSATAQIGGSSTFSQLNFSPSARVNSLGGTLITASDNDVNVAFQNPSLLNKTTAKQLAFNYCNYVSDINYESVYFSPVIKKKYNMAFGLQTASYGKFIETDESGNKIGDFKTADYFLSTVLSKQIDSVLSIGVNFKTLYSHLNTYDSFGAAFDAGITYHKPSKFFTAAFVVKNTGYQFDGFSKKTHEKLPFEMQAGIAKKLKKAPILFSFSIKDLQKWNLDNNPKADTSFKNKFSNITTNFSRHLVIGTELLLTKNFNIRLGFNFQRRQELRVLTKPGMAGFTFGFGFKVSKFHLSYGRAQYNVAGASNLFSITTNISEFSKK